LGKKFDHNTVHNIHIHHLKILCFYKKELHPYLYSIPIDNKITSTYRPIGVTRVRVMDSTAGRQEGELS